eukprot:8835648-Heterocapsa_arctica.AAC.1
MASHCSCRRGCHRRSPGPCRSASGRTIVEDVRDLVALLLDQLGTELIAQHSLLARKLTSSELARRSSSS